MLVAATLISATNARVVHAQLVAKRVALFGTVSGVAGATPVRTTDASHVGVHAGFRLDGGIQGDRLGLGAGFRVWELRPTATYGGHGLDGFALGEVRLGSSLRTTLRFTVGAGFDDIDGGRGPAVPGTGSSGVIWSAGIGHEIPLDAGDLLHLTAELVVPTVNRDVAGRRAPVLEIGLGYRTRRLVSIGTAR
jgi:hypothetical protein